ncbi:MAG: FtsX-like permease family protein [Deltaproteobacteria bacterium]|nr:FtsX-like permease family protein [Deltaproteobacteria bacterium]
MQSSGLIFRQISRIARRNVMRNWRQSFSTILAIAAGFASVALFDGFMALLDRQVVESTRHRGMLGDLMIQQHGALQAGHQDPWHHSLDQKQQKFITEFLGQDPEVERYTKILDMYGIVSAGQQSAVFAGYGYELEAGGAMRGDKWFWNTSAGVPLERAKEPSVILASGLGRIVGCDPLVNDKGGKFLRSDGSFVPEERAFKCATDQVSLTVTTEAGQANIVNFPVAGIHDPGVRDLLKRHAVTDLASAQQMLDTDKISSFHVQLRDPSKIDEFTSRLKAAEAAMPFHLEVVKTFKHPMIDQVVKGLSLQRTIRNIFLVIVVFIVVMAVTNTMMKAVKERTREIGTLRSLGFLRRHIVAMFSLEGMYLSLFACMAGLGSTFVLRELIHLAEIKFSAGMMSNPISIQVISLPMTWAVTGMVLVVLATLTANLASRRAAMMVIADAMRDT